MFGAKIMDLLERGVYARVGHDMCVCLCVCARARYLRRFLHNNKISVCSQCQVDLRASIDY